MKRELLIVGLLVCVMAAGTQAADCGDWGYLEMDFDTNCYVDLADFSKFASQWLNCTHPLDGSCIEPLDVTIVAHKGYSAITPENTIASCNASRNYAGMVEFDVQTTDDEQLVLMHDANVVRTTDGSGLVEDMLFSDIRKLDAGSWKGSEFEGELVPTLNEAILATLPDMTPCIERKTGTPQQYLDILNTLRCTTDVVVISFDKKFLTDLEGLDPNIVTGLLGTTDPLTTTIIEGIANDGIDFIDWRHDKIRAIEVGMVHSAGLELWVWTVNDMDRVQALIDLGVDGITTDNPEAATQILEQQ